VTTPLITPGCHDGSTLSSKYTYYIQILALFHHLYLSLSQYLPVSITNYLLVDLSIFLQAISLFISSHFIFRNSVLHLLVSDNCNNAVGLCVTPYVRKQNVQLSCYLLSNSSHLPHFCEQPCYTISFLPITIFYIEYIIFRPN
jgi:hypothetical protein